MININEVKLYLSDKLDNDSTINLFQELLDNNLLDSMPPLFKQEAEKLLKNGLIFHADRR